MKVALLLTTFNRPQYLEQTLWSVHRADLSKINTIIIVDDCSTDKAVNDLINSFIFHINNTHAFWNLKVFTNEQNLGIKHSLLFGYEYAFSNGYDIVINLDSDAIVRPDFVDRLLEVYKHTPGILTGFHCTTKNANGTDRHKILDTYDFAYWKQSVGGINFCIDKETYLKCVKPALQVNGNWDNNSCILAGGAWCLPVSVIEHIGFDSSMNHNEQPDVADDFYYWNLPNVTLIGVDSQKERLQRAIDICTKWIGFGDVKLLTEPINSKEEYSHFCMKELYKHVNTSHMLVCQHDGYVNNWQAWDNDWLQYDYIGAPWWYQDGYNVGNGGFSLRSRRLMEIVATDPEIKLTHPEDHHICRTYRKYLEDKYGIKFAPFEVAEKFSYEGYMQPGTQLCEQFGLHGKRNILPKQKTCKKYVIGQQRGLGDILFLVPLVRALIEEGNEVIWPIHPEYISIKKHFPDLPMVDMTDIPINYEVRGRINTPFGEWLPYRFASELMGLSLHACMRSKYAIWRHDYLMWRCLTWKRDKVTENALKEHLQAYGDYVLVNRAFGEAARGMKADIPVNGIEMTVIPGFTLIDWLGVIEGAKEFHTSNTSIMYLLELMDLKMPVYVYPRKIWQEVNFEYTRELWTNKKFKFIGE